MDSRHRTYFCILVISCFLICVIDHYILQSTRDYDLFSIPEECTFFRDMDLSGIDLDYLFLKSEQWHLDPYSILTVLLAYDLPFNREADCSKNSIILKQNYLIRNFPDTIQYGKCAVKAAFDGIRFFPVPVISVDSEKLWVEYVDSWGFLRTYGGNRSHEGTDLMAIRNERSLYPVLSITDGIVEKKGWLEKGGYRIGIRSSSGGYFYYAHLSEYADISEGDSVKAGQLLGLMGDTGYGVKEGTHGLFDVHLHLGIFFDWNGNEYSVNPYWVLKYLENKVLSYNYN